MPSTNEVSTLYLADPAATDAFGRRLATASEGRGLVVYLHGELGAGKTSLARALLTRLGAGERIKSPTYSLIEPYTLADDRPAWHLDLYRIADPGELEWLGLDALSDPRALVLVEWPERGTGALPPPDLHLYLAHEGAARSLRTQAASARGRHVLDDLNS